MVPWFMGGCGAAIFGFVTYYSTGIDMFGPSRNWATSMAIIGAVFGALAGSGLGFFLAIIRAKRINSGLIGILYGLILALAVVCLAAASGNQPDWQIPAIAGLCIPAGAITGFLASPGKFRVSDSPNLSIKNS
jgi:hypothetical protein